MTRTRVAIFGSEGMAGTVLSHHLSDVGMAVRNLPRAAFEIGQDDLNALGLADCDFVINAAGMINRPAREALPDAAFVAVNATFPRQLADVCEAQNTRLIHISTDCVFDGAQGGYDEASPTTGTGVYSQTKQSGEPDNAMVLRMSMVGPERKNFYSLLCWFLSQQRPCSGYTDHMWNGLTTLAVARMMARIIEEDLYLVGTRHVLTQDISKYELLRAFSKAFDHRVDIEPVASATSRDMRLRTQYPEFLEALALPTLASQIAELPSYSTKAGHWQVPS